MPRARFRARGDVVYQLPITKKNRNGTTSTTLGFAVCEAGPGVKAADIAKELNGYKAKLLVKRLLSIIPPGSKQEEANLKLILQAERFLEDG